MPGAARFSDAILGQTTGEHHGHVDEDGNPEHPPGVLTGNINSGSSDVIINGLPAARLNDVTVEDDNCGPGVGKIAVGSGNVFINGRPAARNNDKILPHNGEAKIVSSSPNVIIN